MSKNKKLIQNIYHILEQHGISDISEKGLEYNFVNQGDLDSFELLSFITELESILDIEFTAEDLTDKSIQTIEGLSKLILKKKFH